jgi:hypothetical protein
MDLTVSMAISGSENGGTYHMQGLFFRPMQGNIPRKYALIRYSISILGS